MTDLINILEQRNLEFARTDYPGSQPIAPALRTIVLGCVDPRVDPAHVLGLNTGEAVVIRNVGGRVVADVFTQMALLRAIAEADGVSPGPGWTFIVLHHTDCGIKRLCSHPDALARFLGVSTDALDTDSVLDPRTAVSIDIAALQAFPFLPAEFQVAGLVYDVDSGLLDVVVPLQMLREA